MRLLPFLLLFFSFSTLSAQKWVGQIATHPIDQLRAKSHLTTEPIGSNPEAIEDHLLKVIANLKGEESGLNLKEAIESPGGKHFLYQQTINGEKVMGATIKINVDNNGIRRSLFDRSIDPDLVSSMEFPDTSLIRSRLVKLYEGKDMDELAHATVERVYFFNGSSLVPSVRIEVAEQHDHYYEMVLDHNIKVMYQNDLLTYHHQSFIDSPVAAFVFLPDPLSTAEQLYGAPYADQNDASISQLNEQRQAVTIEADFGGTFFSLISQWVIFNEHSAPTNTPAISSTPEFDYTRDNDRFEEVNAFYHINEFQQHIQDLGFDNLANYQISVDVHGLNGADNSNFNNAFNPPRLTFGDGGVDDAEDADVIIHEYGHAIMHSAAPGTNGGTERRSLDEANGDYFAASYSRHLAPFGWERVYSWDGHNEFWNGRMATSAKHYPEDLVGNIYSDAEIWSSTIMEIWGDIGRDITDKILLQSAYSYAEGMSMTDAAYLFIDAEEQLYGAQYTFQIRQRMFDRGLIPWVSIEENRDENRFTLLNSQGFAAGTGDLLVQFPSAVTGTLSVYDATGREILAKSSSESATWRLSPAEILSKGIYTITIRSNQELMSFQVLRASN